MKVAFAVLVAFLLLLAGWLFLAIALWGILYVAARAGGGRTGLLVNVYLIWVLSPGFGGFLATYITASLFKKTEASTITTSFISVIITLAILLAILSFPVMRQGTQPATDLLLMFAQTAAIVFGANVGKNVHLAKKPQMGDSSPPTRTHPVGPPTEGYNRQEDHLTSVPRG